MNILGAVMVFRGNGKAPEIPDWVGFTVIGAMLALALLLIFLEVKYPSRPTYKLKRTKNPYRRYKRVRY